MAVVLALNGDDAEELGKLVDELDTLIAGLLIPLPPELHLKGLAGSIAEKRTSLRDLLSKNGFNPWGATFPWSSLPPHRQD